MYRPFVTVILAGVLALAPPAPLQDVRGQAPAPAKRKNTTVPLVIDGDTYLVVKSLPFNIVAPAGAGDYTWTVPSGVTYQENDNVLTITKAPKGQFVVRVKMTTIDFDAKKIKKDAGEITVVLGAVGPGPGPDPDPDPKPDDSLAKALGIALTLDQDADKAKMANTLGSVYRLASASNGIVFSDKMKTSTDLDNAIRATAQQLIGNLTLPNLRDVVGSSLRARLGVKKDVPLDADLRKRYAEVYAALGVALEGLK